MSSCAAACRAAPEGRVIGDCPGRRRQVPGGVWRTTKTRFITSHDRSRRTAGRHSPRPQLFSLCSAVMSAGWRWRVLYPELRLGRGPDTRRSDGGCRWMCRFQNGPRSTSATRQSSVAHGVEITGPRDPGTPLFGCQRAGDDIPGTVGLGGGWSQCMARCTGGQLGGCTMQRRMGSGGWRQSEVGSQRRSCVPLQRAGV